MGLAISRPVRDEVIQRTHAGESSSQVAEALGVSRRFVRNLVRRFREEGPSALEIHYERCGPRQPRASGKLVDAVRRMRAEHPAWGAPLMWVKLKKQFAEHMVSCRTLQRWLSAGSPSLRSKRPAANVHKAQVPHEVWQVDAAEDIRLASGEKVSWLRLVDECSGAFVWTEVFSPAPLEPGAGRRGARRVFERVFAVGASPADSRGQRLALGIDGRLAHRLGPVVDRLGDRSHLESAAAASEKRRGRTRARHRQTLGRTAHVSFGSRTAATDSPSRPLATRRVPARGRLDAPRTLSRPAHAPSRCAVELGFFARVAASGRLPHRTPGQRLRSSLDLQSQSLRGPQIPKEKCVGLVRPRERRVDLHRPPRPRIEATPFWDHIPRRHEFYDHTPP
jgi:hypothetical protein